jgi:carbonic anhydrase
VPDSLSRPERPADALAELIAGNRRFVEGTRIHPNQDAERRASLRAQQDPFAVVFGCSDSRLAAEIIFDRGLGDLFVVRTAGHIIGEDVLASISYGVTELSVPLIVVLGHDSCGAVGAAHAAMTGSRPPGQRPNIIVDRVLPSLLYTEAALTADPETLVDAHVRRTIDIVTSQSVAIADAIAADRLAVVGMSYRLTDGQVSIVGAVPAGAAAAH